MQTSETAGYATLSQLPDEQTQAINYLGLAMGPKVHNSSLLQNLIILQLLAVV